MIRRLAAAVLAIAGLAGGLVFLAPVPAHATAQCAASSVTVVVDFGRLGGGVQVGCANGHQDSGYAALHAAGFSTAGTQHDGVGFICRINNAPPPARESCVDTPPASAYWSYWHSTASTNRWSYSQLGVTAFEPEPGDVEGWSFGSGKAPATSVTSLRLAPSPPAAARTTPAHQPDGRSTHQPSAGPSTSAAARSEPTAAKGSAVVPHAMGGPTSAATGTSVSGRPSATDRPAPPASARPSDSSTSSDSPETTGAATGRTATSAATAAPRRVAERTDDSGGGFPLRMVGIIVLIWGLGTAAGIVSWRRRRDRARS